MPAAESPRLTVIIPSLNHGRFIERAICSVVDQGYENLELMVVDGGSTDESVPLIQHYDDDITYWHSQGDAGPADAVNHAIKRATGEWVLILHADDLLLPGVLHQAAERMATTGGDWLVGRCRRIGGRDEAVGDDAAAAPATLLDAMVRDAGREAIRGSFFRRSMLMRVGRLDGQLRYTFGYDLCCRLLMYGIKPVCLPLTVAACREHAASQTARQPLPHGVEWLGVTERYADQLPMEPRYAMWNACEQARQVLAIAQAESAASASRRYLWEQLLHEPARLMDDEFRTTVLKQVASPTARKRRRATAA
jgi:GT2 family glycosyltransferase